MASLRYNHKLRTRVNKLRTMTSSNVTLNRKSNADFPETTSVPFPTPTPLPVFISTIFGDNILTIDGLTIQGIV